MSDAARFLTALAQTLSTMALYAAGHPARERAIDASFDQLRRLQETEPAPHFSFLGQDVVLGQRVMRELRDWDWGVRLANAGIQRLEMDAAVSRVDYEQFLEDVLARLALVAVDTSTVRQERRSSIRFGAVGVRGAGGELLGAEREALPVATIAYTLHEEAEAVRWMHAEVGERGQLPLVEAEAVVRSLSVAMHADSEIMIPLVQLKEFDQYTTTHSLNVSVLAMALAEYTGMGARDVRAFGVAGLLHDLGKVRIPKEILTKPGKLTDEEWAVMKRHPVDGAKLIIESDRQLDLASVVAYEHHIMLDGGGYPGMHFCRECHVASRLVHVCDVYDALRTNRPYRAAWESERTLAFLEERAGTEMDPELVRQFVAMIREWERRVAVIDDSSPLPLSAAAAPPAPASAPAPPTTSSLTDA